jgi:hypothetical protein
MRTTTVAIVFLLGAATVTSALADARILNVEEAAPPTPVPPVESAPAPAPETAAPEPQTPPAQPEPRAETPPPAVQPPPAAPQPPAPPSRFAFERNQDGFMRFDRQTGEVAYCSSRSVGWACEAVPEERTALEKEIARLQDEVAGLKREIAALRASPPPPRPPAELAPRPPAPKEGDKSGDLILKLPTQEDIDRAAAALQRAWERVVDMIGNLRNGLTRKAPDRTTL